MPNLRTPWPKSRASQAPVPMHPLLATVIEKWMHETPYAESSDWVFPSFKLKGTQPRVANMLVSDYLRPAAVKAGVIAADWDGRFGFHNFRHSLASYLVRSKTDPKTVTRLLHQFCDSYPNKAFLAKFLGRDRNDALMSLYLFVFSTLEWPTHPRK